MLNNRLNDWFDNPRWGHFDTLVFALLVWCIFMGIMAWASGAFAASPIHIGAASRLQCYEFNMLKPDDRDGALSWAFGYYSAYHEQAVNANKLGSPERMTVFNNLSWTAQQGIAIARGIIAVCRARPAMAFVDAVVDVYGDMFAPRAK